MACGRTAVETMGFTSSIMYYRASEPLIVDGATLANFVRAFHALGVSSFGPGRKGGLRLWFGAPSSSLEDELESMDEDLDADIEEYSIPLLEMPDRLACLKRPVRRARLSLGGIAGPQWDPIRRIGSPENDEDFVPDGWSLRLGPVVSGRDCEFLLGSVCVSLSGNGYPYPWTPHDVVLRAESISSVQRVMALCEQMWPIESIEASPRVQAGRRAMGKYWPYERIDRPLGWTWGFAGVA